MTQPAVHRILGVPCMAFASTGEAVGVLRDLVRSGRGGYNVAINAEKVMIARRDRQVARIIDESALPSPDGSGAQIGLRWVHGVRTVKIDMPRTALRVAHENAFRIFLLGAAPDVIGRTLERVRCDFHGAEIVGSHHGFFDDDAAMIERLRAARPDLVLVAMGSPRQEVFARAALDAGVRSFYVGCGGAFNILAGEVRRAPTFYQTYHLEWFYRLLQDPRRLQRVPVFIPFFLRLARQAVVRRMRTS